MLRYVVADLVAGILRPLVRAALAVLAIAFVITVPGRLWILFVDPHASADAISVSNWIAGVLLAGLWILPVLRRAVVHARRRRAR